MTRKPADRVNAESKKKKKKKEKKKMMMKRLTTTNKSDVIANICLTPGERVCVSRARASV